MLSVKPPEIETGSKHESILRAILLSSNMWMEVKLKTRSMRNYALDINMFPMTIYVHRDTMVIIAIICDYFFDNILKMFLIIYQKIMIHTLMWH